MAQSPTSVPGKKRRPSGPRAVKDKVVILLYKGTLEAVEWCFDPMEALDRKEADPSWSYRKVTIPTKRKPTPAVSTENGTAGV